MHDDYNLRQIHSGTQFLAFVSNGTILYTDCVYEMVEFENSHKFTIKEV